MSQETFQSLLETIQDKADSCSTFTAVLTMCKSIPDGTESSKIFKKRLTQLAPEFAASCTDWREARRFSIECPLSGTNASSVFWSRACKLAHDEASRITDVMEAKRCWADSFGGGQNDISDIFHERWSNLAYEKAVRVSTTCESEDELRDLIKETPFLCDASAVYEKRLNEILEGKAEECAKSCVTSGEVRSLISEVRPSGSAMKILETRWMELHLLGL